MKKLFWAFTAAMLPLALHAQLSDEQVAELARRARNHGVSQTEIDAAVASNGTHNGTHNGTSRMRSDTPTVAAPASATHTPASAPYTPAAAQNAAVATPHTRASAPAAPTDIFGHNVFSNKQLSFEPSLNIATPDGYILGPGDEVIVDVWGEAEQTVRQKISPDGTIVVSRLGPIVLSGLTVREAGVKLRASFSRIYSSVGGETSIRLSLGQIRSIQVSVMGEVANPGTYTVSSLASLFHVLYLAGGVNEIGSLRGIGISRGGVRVATADVYQYLLEGRTGVDVALSDGDVVIVPPYRALVSVDGEVKRPMRYELREGETISTLIGFAGGFKGDSYPEAVTVVRRNGRQPKVHSVGEAAYAGFALMDGDSVTVGGIIERFENRLEISGAVFRPGIYALSDSVATVRRLIAHAAGLQGDAFPNRAILTREKDDYTTEVLPLDLAAILSGRAADIALRAYDKLHIPAESELRENYTVAIRGAVGRPGDYPFSDNLTVEDMIVKAGGLLESASTARVDIYRRLKDARGVSESDARSRSYTLSIRDGLVIGGGEEFTLEPFDVVEVRTSPGYEEQKSVAVQGEVLFPGNYTLLKKEERLSDLVGRAGGALSLAYLRGANLTRTMNEGEAVRTDATARMASIGGPDSLSDASLALTRTYRVGINLEKAIENPGSDDDLVLREGDLLAVPEYVGTVSVAGAVLFPNTVSYRKGMGTKEYIRQAGGFAHRARRSTVVVIYMNGTVARSGMLRRARIEPGCEILVPYRATRMNRNRVSLAEILSMGMSATSTAAMVTNLIKK